MTNDQQSQQQKDVNDQKNTTGNAQESASDMNANITREDQQVLENLENPPGSDDANRVYLDSTDDDGVTLNEKAGKRAESGDDLDVPGAELDDADEAIGEEDEENNSYSEADTD